MTHDELEKQIDLCSNAVDEIYARLSKESDPTRRDALESVGKLLVALEFRLVVARQAVSQQTASAFPAN